MHLYRGVCVASQRHLVMMGRQQAQERLAIFQHSVADRQAGLSRNQSGLTLSTSRSDIASNLCLVVETDSRLFRLMDGAGILAVNRTELRILCPDLLAQVCDHLPDRLNTIDTGRVTLGSSSR
jgi:CRP/FNR family transcriptional regulator